MTAKNIIVYQSEDGKVSFDVNIDKDTVWLSQPQMADLFDTSRENITLHISNIYKEKELSKIPTCKDFLQVQKEGNRQVKRDIEHYSLDVIISVGYRVKSKRGTQFRIWANKILRDHILNGYTINDQRYLQQTPQVNIENSVIYIDTIQYQNQAEIPKKVKEELKKGLEKIEAVLTDKNLKKIISEYRDDIKYIDKKISIYRRIQNFIVDLGDPNTAIHKMLNGRGVAKKILLEVFKLGMEALSRF